MMTVRRSPAKPSEPATLPPHRAIGLLRRQLDTAAAIAGLTYDDPKVEAWISTTREILNGAFGKPGGELEERTAAFVYEHGGPLHAGMTPYEYQQNHQRATDTRMALLEAYIDQLGILAPPAARADADQYGFHPDIETVAGALYRDGHYKQAALEAFIHVITAVKDKSRLALDGDKLMNRAFGCTGQTPVIQFNSLNTDEEKDEQVGFLYLYKGVVALRNSKAHTNRLFDDPARAHEYLALASVLVRILDGAQVNPTT